MGTQEQLIEKIESTVGWHLADHTEVSVVAVNPQNQVKLLVTWKQDDPRGGVQFVQITEPDEFGNVETFALGADVVDKYQHAIDVVEKYDVLNYGTNRG